MPIRPSTTLAQIEFATQDHPLVERFLKGVFGAGRLEEAFSEKLSVPDIVQTRAYGLGEALLQFVHPIDSNVDHYAVVDKFGPALFNLTWFVESIAEAIDTGKSAGIDALWEYDVAALLASPGSASSEVKDTRATMLNCRDTLGFHIEMSESPAPSQERDPNNPHVCPLYHHPRPASEDLVGLLETLNLVVTDIQAARSAILQLFGQPEISDVEQGPDGQRFSVVLGEGVLCFFQPDKNSDQQQLLDQYGSCLDLLAYPTENLDRIKQNCAEFDIQVTRDDAALKRQMVGHSGGHEWHEAWRVHSRATIGTDFLLLR